jgi:hypothetical protein
VTAAGPASKRAAAAGRAVFPAACGWVPVAADVSSEPASEKLRTKLLAEADAFRSARTNEALGYLLDRWLPSASGRLRWPVSGSIPPCSCSQRHPSDLARATQAQCATGSSGSRTVSESTLICTPRATTPPG